MKPQTCATCHFGELIEAQFPGPEVRCRRFPKALFKRPADWCGEHKSHPKEKHDARKQA
jgi:hypothetical protein